MDKQPKWTNVFIAFETDLLALLVKIEDDKAYVVKQTKLKDFQSNKDSFLQTLDDILGSFFDQTGVEAKESIFILSQDWLIANDLTPSRKVFLKEAKKVLGLKVSGFVVLEEALTFSLKKQLLTDPSYILFTILPGLVCLTQVELGRVSQHVSVGRSDDLTADITEALSRLQQSVKPLRLVFVNLSSLENQALKQQINQLNWQTELGFPQEPKIDFWSSQHLLTQLLMVVFGETKNQTINVIWDKSALGANHTDRVTQSESEITPKAVSKQSWAKIETEVSETKIKANIHGIPNEPNKQTDSPSQSQSPTQSDLAKLGVIIPEDGSESIVQSISKPTRSKPLTTGLIDKVKFNPSRLIPNLSFLSLLPTLVLKPAALTANLIPKGGGIGLKLLSWLLPLIFIPILGGILYYAFFSAQITITPKTSTIKRSLVINFDTQISQADLAKGVVPARLLEFEVAKKAQAPTTGRSQQGEPGRGRLTIYNKSSKVKEFKKGTLLYLGSDKTKKVALLETVKVASQSSQTNENEVTTLIPGKAEAEAETTYWGEEANLSQNTELFFVGLDKDIYKAKVSQAFSGGKKYEVRSVSEDDVARLKEDIQTQIQSSVNQLVQDKLEAGEAVIDSSLKIEPIKTNLSHKVGEAAESVSLESQNRVSVLVYRQADLEALIDKAIVNTTPAGFEIDKSNIKWEFKPRDDQSYQLDLIISLKWSFDTDIIRTNLTGKDKNSAYFYLQNLPGIFAFKITFRPPVPPALQRMPYRRDNIVIQVQ